MNAMAQGPKPFSFTRSVIRSESDVVSVRQRARRLAELLGFDRRDQTRMATAVSELARNAFIHGGGGGEAEFSVELTAQPQVFTARISDSGPGIETVEAVLSGDHPPDNGMGLGIVSARRLLDRFEIVSEPGKGVTISAGIEFPKRARRLERADLASLAKALEKESASDLLTMMREQNRELVQALEDIDRREEESRKLTQELGDTNRGVVALYAELDERAEQLRKASESKTRFLSNMSHEFRTPLNSILALSRLLLDRVDGELSPEQERQVGYIRRSVETLLDLVNDMLDLSKVEAGKTDVRPVEFSVSGLLAALRGALKPLLTNPSVELTFEIDKACPDLYTDEAKVSQILRNLISNALKFTERGEVRVAAVWRPDDGAVDFSVKDTGIGIADEDQERIFEEFAQVDSKLQRKVKGTGLGLSLSRSLAKLLGGTLTVESAVNAGSTFTLSIPASVSDQANPPAAEQGQPRKVLLVDDDDMFRYVMRQIVSNAPEYRLIEAKDGEEGLLMARTEAPDVVILDLQMPGMDGFAVFEALAADPETQPIPIVVLTSLAVDAGLNSRFPPGTRLLSKNMISRESVSLFLREAAQAAR